MTQEDDNCFGNVVSSFAPAMMISASPEVSRIPTGALALKMTDGSISVLKFMPEMLELLCDKLTEIVSHNPSMDQRDALEQMLELQGDKEITFAGLSEHPVWRHLNDIPTFPENVQIFNLSHYVQAAHIMAYPSVVKFDFSMKNDEVHRYTMPSSIVPILSEALEAVRSQVRALSSPH